MEYLEEVKEDYSALRIVSPAYAGRNGELTAILQYVFQGLTLGGMGKKREGEILMGIANDEMRHFEMLGALICKLGAPPVFTSCPPYPVGYYSASSVDYTKNPRAMLIVDIKGEKSAIEQYRQMIEKLNQKAVIEVIEKILRDEEEHLALLESLLEEID